MTSLLAHRGPDGSGHFFDGCAGLAMTRLAIIDIAGGQQPKSARDGDLQVVFNGEIYNHRALRRELVALGHAFESDSDSEVVARGFDQWGPEAFRRMHGMFAVAVWDRKSHRLTLARDRIGKKPLYVWIEKGSLAFASELKALAAVRAWPAVDQQAFADYLQLGFVPAPRSIWCGIHKLPAGHVAEWKDKTFHSRPFWELDRDAPDLRPDDPVEALRERLHASVGPRLVADVEVGVLLSGGIDSSLVAWTASQQRPGVHTFTVGFEDPELDESGPASALATALGTTHHQIRATASDALAIVHELPAIFDEPFADASAVPTLLVSRFAAEHVKVVLGGDGGDELFSGYARYEKFARMLTLQRMLPHPSRRLGRHLLPSSNRLVRQAGTVLDRWGDSSASTYLNVMGIAPPSLVEALLGRPTTASPAVVTSFEKAFIASPHRAPRYADLACYLPDDVLTKVDRASMSTGLEVRAPFLDTELVEWAARLAPECLGALGSKSLPRALLATRFPELSRRPKQGFGIPLESWLRGPLRPLVDDLLSTSSLALHGLVQDEAVKGLRARLGTPGSSAAGPVWALLIFQLWYQRWASSSTK
jgi:asparagine synthase (glutamine-hydrolysing)